MQNSKILFVSLLSAGSVGLALASGCSSSSNKATVDSGPEEETGSTSSSSSGGPAEASPLGCTSAQSCATGQICCGTMSETVVCQAGPCTATVIGVVQPCASSTECTFAPNTVCSAPTGEAATLLAAGGITMTCNPPSGEGGTTEGGTHEGGTTEGGSDSGSSSGGEGGADTGSSDAPTEGG